MPDKWHRVAINVDDETFELFSAIPHGIRSAVLRTLGQVAVRAAKKHGTMIYGAIIDGDFELVYKGKKRNAS